MFKGIEKHSTPVSGNVKIDSFILTESGRKMSLATYDGIVMITLLACTETTPSGVSYTNTYPLPSDFVMLVSFQESLTLLPKLQMKEVQNRMEVRTSTIIPDQ